MAVAAQPAVSPTPGADRARQRIALRGPRDLGDPRNTPWKGDLADIALAGRLFVPHFVKPVILSCGGTPVALRDGTDADAKAVSQLLPGERFAVLEETRGRAWGYSLHDNYVGWIDRAALIAPGAEPTHVVSQRAALVFDGPDIKSPVLSRLPMGARLACGAPSDDGKFLSVDGGGFVHARFVEAIGMVSGSPADLAERLVGAPYLWGGRSGDGIDCSGLVQMVLGLTGIDAPRDSDQQRDTLGEALPDGGGLIRGDLVYFPGHVGMMLDSERLIHANAHWMRVAIEPLADVIARQEEGEASVIARKRLNVSTLS